MELKLYKRLKQELLRDLTVRSENHDPAYQQAVEMYASPAESGVSRATARKIRAWLEQYNRLQSSHFGLRYYQILALAFTEHVLEAKRAGLGYPDQKTLVYWMATGSGKTLLMHLNILQYIDHIGGSSAFDELQLIVTTPGVNLIEQHQRELGSFVTQLNRVYNNRIKLIATTTSALLNKEHGYFDMPASPRFHRLVLVDEGHIGLSAGGKEVGAFKKLRHSLVKGDPSFLFEYSATYHGIAEKHVEEYEEQIVYDYNYYRFFKDGYGKDYSIQRKSDDRFADEGKREARFFTATFDTLLDKLRAYQSLSIDSGDGLPFGQRFPHVPLLAFMGNTVEDPKKEGGEKDEVSDIRKFLVWLVHLDKRERETYRMVFHDQHLGKLKLTRTPGIADEIWLSWGDGEYWGLINVGNGEKFFRECEEHEQLHAPDGESLVTFAKVGIIHPRYHFSAIDTELSPIRVLLGSRKFAEGWNCYRVSIIGLINLGSSKGNKIIQMYGRGVRLKGLVADGKRHHLSHNENYQDLIDYDSDAKRLRRLETLNIFGIRRMWLETFLAALDEELPLSSGPYRVPVKPSIVQIRDSDRQFQDYQDDLQTFKVGRTDFDAPLRLVFDPESQIWEWSYVDGLEEHSATVDRFVVSLDYRSEKERAGKDLAQEFLNIAGSMRNFLRGDTLTHHRRAWCHSNRIRIYTKTTKHTLKPVDFQDLLLIVNEIRYDHSIEERSWSTLSRMLEEVQRDLLARIYHKIRYDIDRRNYRFEAIQLSDDNSQGDVISEYEVTFDFENREQLDTFEAQTDLPGQLELELRVPGDPYHIYEPLYGAAESQFLAKNKIQNVRISPDSLNPGERKFLKDLRAFLATRSENDGSEYFLMRNVESLKSVGLYLEGELRSFFPDFVLWIVNKKINRTTIVLFDPKGQTGIIDQSALGVTDADVLNEKVAIATSGKLEEIAAELHARTDRDWRVFSFILLRDSSPAGKWKSTTPTEHEFNDAERLIKHHILRLDWHSYRENGESSVPFPDGRTYLDRIFEIIDITQ